MERLLGFYQQGRNEGSFDQGIESALRFLLTDPKFVFRFERDPASVAAGARVSRERSGIGVAAVVLTVEQHSRRRIADPWPRQGKLKDPAVLEAQVRRMLADPRSEALCGKFRGPVAVLAKRARSEPEHRGVPRFDDNLREGFARRPTFSSTASFMRTASVMDPAECQLHVRERASGAALWNSERVWQPLPRVTITDDARKGLLGQGSFLLVTSYATRTSPVLRGKWILENVLGTPVPPPPPNVPALKENAPGAKPLSVARALGGAPQESGLRVCHKIMDPVGFALENFDAVGQWRDSDAGNAIDCVGRIGGRTKVDGPVALRKAIVNRPETFAGT